MPARDRVVHKIDGVLWMRWSFIVFLFVFFRHAISSLISFCRFARTLFSILAWSTGDKWTKCSTKFQSPRARYISSLGYLVYLTSLFLTTSILCIK